MIGRLYPLPESLSGIVCRCLGLSGLKTAGTDKRLPFGYFCRNLFRSLFDRFWRVFPGSTWTEDVTRNDIFLQRQVRRVKEQ